MSTTLALLDAAKAKQSITSDYQLAKLLGVRTSCLSNYRNGRSSLDDSMALRVSELADTDPLPVIAALHGERAKRPEEKAVWQSILQRLGRRDAATSAASQPGDGSATLLAKTAETASLKIM